VFSAIVERDELGDNTWELNVSRVSGTPPSKWVESSIPQFFLDLHVRTQYEKQQPNFARWLN